MDASTLQQKALNGASELAKQFLPPRNKKMTVAPSQQELASLQDETFGAQDPISMKITVALFENL